MTSEAGGNYKEQKVSLACIFVASGYDKGMDQREEKEEGKGKKEVPALMPLALEIGFSVAIPLIILALSGRLLDKHLESSPLFLIIGIILSMVVSTIVIYVKMRPYL